MKNSCWCDSLAIKARQPPFDSHIQQQSMVLTSVVLTQVALALAAPILQDPQQVNAIHKRSPTISFPFGGVTVDKDSVSVKAPFVNLNIPRPPAAGNPGFNVAGVAGLPGLNGLGNGRMAGPLQKSAGTGLGGLFGIGGGLSGNAASSSSLGVVPNNNA
jgi:hypothetical protein